MKERRKDSRETYDFDKNIKHRTRQYAKDDLIDRPVNQAKRYEIKGQGIPVKGAEGELTAEEKAQAELEANLKEEMLREDTAREMSRRKDARETYDFDKDVRYKRKPYADNDIIDRPVNQGVRYEIKGRIPKKGSGEGNA